MDFSNIARQLNEGVSLDAAASAAEKATTGGQKQKEGTMNAREKQKSQMAAQQQTPVKSDVSYASEGYKPFPADKVTRKVKALDAEKAMGMNSPKKAKRRMKMDMAVYVDKDPELRGMHRSAKQTVEKENRERGRKKMEEQRSEREYAKMISNESSDWRKELIEAAQPDEEGNHPYVDVMPFMNQKQQEAKRQMKGAAKAGERQQGNAMQPSGMSESRDLDMDIALASTRDKRISDQEKKVPKSRLSGESEGNRDRVYYDALDQSGPKEKKAKEKAIKSGKPVKHPSLGDGHNFDKMSGAKMKGPKMKGVIKKMSEGLSVEDQMKVSQDYFKKRAARSPEEKASEKKSEAQSRAKTYAMHKKPDPYKARAGESD